MHASVRKVAKTLLMMVLELRRPSIQSVKHLLVRGQNARIATQANKAIEGIQERLQRVQVAPGPDADVRRDLGQNLIAADENLAACIE